MTKLSKEAAALEENLLKQAREELSRADTKISITLAGFSISLGAAITSLVSNKWNPTQDLVGFLQPGWWLCVVLELIGIFFLGKALYPQTLQRQYPENQIVSYYGNIAKLDKATFRSHLEFTAKNGLANTNQLIEISRIVNNKYRYLQIGMIMIAIGIILLITIGIISSFI